MASILAPDRPAVRGYLDFLTYRALRLSAGLPPEDACAELVAALRPLALDATPASTPAPNQKGPRP